jgi:hypothetical protein
MHNSGSQYKQHVIYPKLKKKEIKPEWPEQFVNIGMFETCRTDKNHKKKCKISLS